MTIPHDPPQGENREGEAPPRIAPSRGRRAPVADGRWVDWGLDPPGSPETTWITRLWERLRRWLLGVAR